jgi:adenylosuccinate lyase
MSTFSNTLSPLDNRYQKQVEPITKHFSLFNQTKQKAIVEVKYFISLLKYIQTNNKKLEEDLRIPETYNLNHTFEPLLNRVTNMNNDDFEKIQDFESTCHHDIKAIEYWIREIYDELYTGTDYHQYKEFIHFGLTSQDINHTAFDLILHACIETLHIKIFDLISLLIEKSEDWNNITMLAYTHGQAAVPTKLGKELQVFIERINYNAGTICQFVPRTKMGGAVGNMNAHYAVYPDLDWRFFFYKFVKTDLRLHKWQYTTQITNYESLSDVTSVICNLNTTLLDLCQDIWLYCHKDYFKIAKENAGQVGSSTMPQKVNPINFENAEGNLKMANAVLGMMCEKLPVSRMQRDLTDSTVLRNYGVGIGHMYLSLENIIRGIKKLSPNTEVINNDLLHHPEVLGEAVQCILRVYGIPNAYDIVREASQNKSFKNEDEYICTIIETINSKIGEKHTKYNSIITKINKLSINTYTGVTQ